MINHVNIETMKISAIVAMSENRVIGKNNRLPWHLPADLKHFKTITMGKPVLMGRKTFDSIGRPLPGRLNIIITRDTNYSVPGCVVVHSIDDAIAKAGNYDEIFVIGGAELFQQMFSRIQTIYLTIIHENFDGDAFFPEFNQSEWKEVAREKFSPDEQNKYSFSFITLQKK
jgi:dihydrofolate reductase